MTSDLETILMFAETAKEPPEEPRSGIPPQKLPSWIRWPLRLIMLIFIFLELGAEKIAKWIIRPPFTRVGSCHRRGNCCYYILLPYVKGFLGKILSFWYTEVYGFYLREDKTFTHEGKKIQVMGCRYLQKNGACSHYFFRPKICRIWPIIEVFGRPRLLKGCGFQAKLKGSYAKKYPSLHILQEEIND